MKTYRAALIGCSRMGAFIDNEVSADRYPYSHAAGYEACDRTELVACSDLRPDVHGQGRRALSRSLRAPVHRATGR